MAKIKLTKSAVDAAQPQDKAIELRDTVVPGFLCKIALWPTGSVWPASIGARSCSPADAMQCWTMAWVSRLCPGGQLSNSGWDSSSPRRCEAVACRGRLAGCEGYLLIDDATTAAMTKFSVTRDGQRKSGTTCFIIFHFQLDLN